MIRYWKLNLFIISQPKESGDRETSTRRKCKCKNAPVSSTWWQQTYEILATSAFNLKIELLWLNCLSSWQMSSFADSGWYLSSCGCCGNIVLNISIACYLLSYCLFHFCFSFYNQFLLCVSCLLACVFDSVLFLGLLINYCCLICYFNFRKIMYELIYYVFIGIFFSFSFNKLELF